MALIKCIECGKDISEKATNCPFCGNPIKPVLIEQTSKKWKKTKLIAWLLIIGGFFAFGSGNNNGGFQNPITGLGFTLIFVGIITLWVGKFGAWWHHR